MRAVQNTLGDGLLALTFLFWIGCGESVEYLDETKLLPAEEKLLEFPLGHHRMPLPIAISKDDMPWSHGNAFYLSFDLYAIIHPSHEKDVLLEWKRQEGNFHYDVIELCRHATLDELTEETDLTTLKERLTELAARRLGESRIRRVVFSNINLQPL